MYKDIESQINIAIDKGQKLIIVGDFNCKVGTAIPHNKPQVSVGGRLLLQMIKKKDLLLLNGLQLCNGIWTREEKGKHRQ